MKIHIPNHVTPFRTSYWRICEKHIHVTNDASHSLLYEFMQSQHAFSSLNIVFDFPTLVTVVSTRFSVAFFGRIIFCAKEIPCKIFFTLTKTSVHSVTIWFNYFRRCFVSHCLTAGCQLCQINKLFTGLTITHEDKAQCTRHPIKSVISRA